MLQLHLITGSGELPLSGRRVLITAPRQYASRLGARLLEAGGRPAWVPAIEVRRLSSQRAQQELSAALLDLPSYDVLAFTSANGIYAALACLAAALGGRRAAVEHLNSSGASIYALGVDTEVLRREGVAGVRAPARASTGGLVEELAGAGLAAGRRVLCPVPVVESPLREPYVVPRFLAGLRQAGAEAVRVDAYETALGSTPAACAAELQLLESGGIQAIAFSSTAEAQGLAYLMGGADVILRAVTRHGVVLAAHGPFTAAGAGGVLGATVDCVSKDYSSFAGLVAALEQRFAGAA